MSDEIEFKAKIIKMGTKKIIIIPKALDEMIKDLEKGNVMIKMTKY